MQSIISSHSIVGLAKVSKSFDGSIFFYTHTLNGFYTSVKHESNVTENIR